MHQITEINLKNYHTIYRHKICCYRDFKSISLSVALDHPKYLTLLSSADHKISNFTLFSSSRAKSADQLAVYLEYKKQFRVRI